MVADGCLVPRLKFTEAERDVSYRKFMQFVQVGPAEDFNMPCFSSFFLSFLGEGGGRVESEST